MYEPLHCRQVCDLKLRHQSQKAGLASCRRWLEEQLGVEDMDERTAPGAVSTCAGGGRGTGAGGLTAMATALRCCRERSQAVVEVRAVGAHRVTSIEVVHEIVACGVWRVGGLSWRVAGGRSIGHWVTGGRGVAGGQRRLDALLLNSANVLLALYAAPSPSYRISAFCSVVTRKGRGTGCPRYCQAHTSSYLPT